VVSEVSYAGIFTRYTVALDAGGVLVVSKQNTEAPALDGGAGGALDGVAGIARGTRVRVSWQPAQAFTIPERGLSI
jgi:hypothetical protein